MIADRLAPFIALSVKFHSLLTLQLGKQTMVFTQGAVGLYISLVKSLALQASQSIQRAMIIAQRADQFLFHYILPRNQDRLIVSKHFIGVKKYIAVTETVNAKLKLLYWRFL